MTRPRITRKRVLVAIAACEVALVGLDVWLIFTDRDML